MWKVVVLLALLPGVVQASSAAKVQQAAELMLMCEQQPAQCESTLELVKNNILFTAHLASIAADKPDMIAELLEVPAAECAMAVTAPQLRKILVGYHNSMNVATVGRVGVDVMVFNALTQAAAENCGL